MNFMCEAEARKHAGCHLRLAILRVPDLGLRVEVLGFRGLGLRLGALC